MRKLSDILFPKRGFRSILFVVIGPVIGLLAFFLFVYSPIPDMTELNEVKQEMENTIGLLTIDTPRYCGDEIYYDATSLKNEFDELVERKYRMYMTDSDMTYTRFKNAIDAQKASKKKDMDGYETAMRLLKTNFEEWSLDNRIEWNSLMRQDSGGLWVNEYMSSAHLDTINARYQQYQQINATKGRGIPSIVTPQELFYSLTWENVKDGPDVFFMRFDVGGKLKKTTVSIIRTANKIGKIRYEEAYHRAKIEMHGKDRLFYLNELLNEMPSNSQAEEKNDKIVINSPSKLFLCLTWENVKDGGRLFYEKYEVKESNLKHKVDAIIKQANRIGRVKYMQAYEKAKEEPDSLNNLEKHVKNVDLDEYMKWIDEEAKEMAPKFGLG